jgi:nanoRNase/pAp phosphatase (c-di-AMP/oligoRNAs hydrolase)
MPEQFDYVYSDTTVPATCQMVYHFIQANQDEKLVNVDIAQCLYTGIMTDTGGFRFRSTSATTHRIVADLIEKGAIAIITSNTWDTNTISRLSSFFGSWQNRIGKRWKSGYSLAKAFRTENLVLIKVIQKVSQTTA